MRAALVLLLVACSPPADHKLPGAPVGPKPRIASDACGDDVSQGGAPIVRYLYAFDVFGRLAHATGTFVAGGPSDSIDYTYDNLDHMTHMTESRGPNHAETVALYDTLGDLIDYAQTDNTGTRRYSYSDLTSAGQAGRELISYPGQPALVYHLEYDTFGRLARTTVDGSPSVTTYTYDDAESRTVTIDTDSGAFHGEVIYDDHDHELSESWTGTSPQQIDSDTRYEYDGDRLLSATFRQASQGAPHDLQILEIDTLRYDCTPRHR